MSHDKNTRILLASRPKGAVSPENFRVETTTIPSPREGEVLLKVLFLSLDPYMRGRMDDAKSYAAPVEVGHVMEGGTVAEIIESRNNDFSVGDIVLSHSGWQSHAISDGNGLTRLDPNRAPISTALGILGMPGLTAYTGLLTIGRPKPGETVVVAAASGPVGSAVGQIARIKGARAVGIAGGPEKCAFIRNELGFDTAVDHRAPDFAAQLQQACPDGIDVYYENVGGPVWDAVFPLLNTFARVPVCGLISHYDVAKPSNNDRLPKVMRAVLTKSLTVRGFIFREFVDQRPAFLKDMSEWLRTGQVKYREDIVDGLANAPDAFMGMLKGRNFGKLIVRVA